MQGAELGLRALSRGNGAEVVLKVTGGLLQRAAGQESIDWGAQDLDIQHASVVAVVRLLPLDPSDQLHLEPQPVWIRANQELSRVCDQSMCCCGWCLGHGVTGTASTLAFDILSACLAVTRA